MSGYDSRVPADAFWCITKHLGGKIHAFEVYQKLAELGDSGVVLSRDLPDFGFSRGALWRDVFLYIYTVLEAVDLIVEDLVATKDNLNDFLNTVRNLRRLVLLFRIDYRDWAASRKQRDEPVFESALLQEAMSLRDDLYAIEKHIGEVLRRYAVNSDVTQGD